MENVEKGFWGSSTWWLTPCMNWLPKPFFFFLKKGGKQHFATLTALSKWVCLVLYLHLFQRDFKAEGLVVVRVQGVLLHRRLLLLQALTSLQQLDLHIRICKRASISKSSDRDHQGKLMQTNCWPSCSPCNIYIPSVSRDADARDRSRYWFIGLCGRCCACGIWCCRSTIVSCTSRVYLLYSRSLWVLGLL